MIYHSASGTIWLNLQVSKHWIGGFFATQAFESSRIWKIEALLREMPLTLRLELLHVGQQILRIRDTRRGPTVEEVYLQGSAISELGSFVAVLIGKRDWTLIGGKAEW